METRSQPLFRHTQAYLHATGTAWPTLAQNVVDNYHAAVPPGQRAVHFKTGGDAYQAARINAQHIKRMYTGDSRLPADLEEAWAAAIPAPWHEALLRDLAGRYGLLAAPVPQEAVNADVQSISRLLQETGEAIEALAPILEDGLLSASDAPLAANALHEVDDVLGMLASIRTRLVQLVDVAINPRGVLHAVPQKRNPA